MDPDPRIHAVTSVADPDPPDPHVFGPPGSGSTSKKSLDSYYVATLFVFLSLKMM